jgi:hypothetical protein
MSHRRMPKTNRWDCLKPEGSSEDAETGNERVNRFKAPSSGAPTNSRWKRSPSPEIKINTFKTRRRGGGGGGGGRGHFRNNRRGKRGPSIFDNVKRDQSGRPILKGSTNQGFDITSVMNIKQTKISNKERKKLKEAQKKKEKEEAQSRIKAEEERIEKETDEFKANSDWNKAMMERYMYEEESSSDEEDSDED